METVTILRYGTTVQLVNPDMYGYNGREKHPTRTDVGFLGNVVGNFVEFYDEDGCPADCKKNVLGMTEFVTHEAGVVVCYVVKAPDGRELELMDHEIEVI